MLYTGKGDGGTSKLFNCPPGTRISKADDVFGVLGSLDGLNSFLGLVKIKVGKLSIKTDERNFSYTEIIHDVQEKLFIIQAEVAGAPKTIQSGAVTYCENIINSIEPKLPPITSFIISGGSEESALLDIARTKARAVEREIISLQASGNGKVGDETMRYMNRLSSLLYALARYANFQEKIEESHPNYN